MGGLSSLNLATSGMLAAQAGLYVTGHNMANSSVPGYSRQRVIQSASPYVTIGYAANSKMQTGLGVEVDGIRQIRNKYLDMQYRAEASRLGFHEIKFATGNEIETIVGELESDYKAQSVMQDMWDAINEMVIDPTGIETRGIFITTAATFINKVDNVSQRLLDEQMKLNDEIISTVSKVNNYLNQVKELNDKIRRAEVSGDAANDYRDTREVYIDELSHIFDLTVKIDPRTGMVNLFTEGKELLVDQSVNTLGLRYTAAQSPFVEPIFTTETHILQYEPYSDEYQNTRTLYNLTGTISAEQGNDGGLLKGMLVSRGTKPINYAGLPNEPAYTILNPGAVGSPQSDFASALSNIINQNRPIDISALLLDGIAGMDPINPIFPPKPSGGPSDPAWGDYHAALEKVKENIEMFTRVTGMSISVPRTPDLPSATFTPPQTEAEWIEEWKQYENFSDSIRSAYNKSLSVARSFEKNLIDIDALRFSEGLGATGTNAVVRQAIKFNEITMKEYKKDLFNATQATIPTFQRQFDTLVNTIVTLVNDAFSPTQMYDHDEDPLTPDVPMLSQDAPYGLDGSQGTEIFVRKQFNRFDEHGFLIMEDARDEYTMYSMGNIQINPIFAQPANYAKIPHSPSGDVSDTSLLQDILGKWKAGCAAFEGGDPLSVENYYKAMIVDVAVKTNTSRKFTETQLDQVQQADAKRMQLSGVAMDEELTNMMKYQHSYNAAARVFNVIDSMLDTMINRM